MKKLITILLMALTASITMCGQTFHAIIFANTHNRGIGESVEVDLKRMSLEMTTIAKSIGYPLKKHFYYGPTESFNHVNLEKVLTNLSCGPDDVVFFFYSGHGGRAVNEKTDFPEMCLFVNDENLNSKSQFYPLYDVFTRIKKKNPRLTIVMGDLCNSPMKGFYRNDNNASKGATILSKGTCNVYQNLFLNTRGGLIAASSEPEYPSGCYVFQDNGKWYDAGGFLTHSFLCVLQYFVGHNEDVSWTSLMDNTIGLTQELSKTDLEGNPQRPQTPIYKSEIEPVHTSTTNTEIVAAPQPPLSSNDSETNQQDNMAYSLSMVCNQSVPKLDRIRNIAKAKNYFENNAAMVQVIGFDNKTIVNTCTIESYLNYLSMATKMDQVVILDTKKNSAGKVTYMRVHEIHYQ